MTPIRTVLVLILISLIVTLSVQLTKNYSDKPSTDTPSQRDANIDYSIDNFTLTSMNVNGRIRYQLNATSMWHYQQTDKTLLQSPNIELYNQSGESWLIHAENGAVEGNSKRILFTRKVVIQRPATNQQKPFIITTESLLIDAEKNTISTDDFIKLTSEGLSIQSKGMHTNLQTQTIRFLSHVRSVYAP